MAADRCPVDSDWAKWWLKIVLSFGYQPAHPCSSPLCVLT